MSLPNPKMQDNQNLAISKQKNLFPLVAYFSMEFGLNAQMNTYSGGLGILAGDTLKSAADMNLPMIGISLLYKKGWLKQTLDIQKGQIEKPDSWDYQKILKLRKEKFSLEIADQKITVQIWEYKVKSFSKNQVPIFFLDADLPENDPKIREANQIIYSPDQQTWFYQEALLGLGGPLALEVLGHKNISVYHLNESHAAFLALFLAEKFKSWDVVRSKMCFTTHTPLSGAHQKVALKELKKLLPSVYFEVIPQEVLKDDKLDFTELCIYASKFSNGVAIRHQEVSQKMYPDYKIGFVTNGIHHLSWVSKYLQKVFDKNIIDWKNNPNFLRQILRVPGTVIQKAHQKSKNDLIDKINSGEFEGIKSKNLDFDPKIFTIGFARRAVPYKRASFIFSQLERLKAISSKFGGLQLVFAGKTGDSDLEGKKIIASILKIAQESDQNLRVVYLQNYNMEVASYLVSGVDLWLNNPLPPLEASGTSGMKASLNGIPSLSILDGWWPEGCLEGITGWAIGSDLCEGDECRLTEIEDLYSKLENTILPIFYRQKEYWAEIQKSCIALNGSYFNTHRMLTEYLMKGYLT